jgi:hypothetical protein
VHVDVNVKKNLPVKKIRIFSVSDAQTDTHCGEVTASYPASNVYPGYRKERYSLKEFLHPLPGDRHQNEVYSLKKNYYMDVYVQQIESAQEWILGVGALLSICDSGASLLCVHESPIERLQKPAKTLKVHKNENFFGFDFEFCPISLLVMHK